MITKDIGETTRRVQRDVTLLPQGFAIQPPWALNAVILQVNDIEFLHTHKPNQVDVAQLPFQEAHAKSIWTPNTNRSVRGQLLAAGNIASANGIGVHAACGLTFDRVKVREHPKVKLEVHIDTDEGNACDLRSATRMELLK